MKVLEKKMKAMMSRFNSKPKKMPYKPGTLGKSEVAGLLPRKVRRLAANFTPVYNGPEPVYVTPMIMAAKAEKEKAYKERKKARQKKKK